MNMKYIFLCVAMLFAVTSANAGELTREYCRKKASETEAIECIKRGIWNPCEEGSSDTSYWGSLCVSAHNHIKEEKIQELKIEISNLIGEFSVKSASAKDLFLKSEEEWTNYRDSYCEFSNILAVQPDLVKDKYDAVQRCLSGKNYQHLKDLEALKERLIKSKK